MKTLKVSAVQMQCSTNREENVAKAEKLITLASENGAKLILLPELFERQYFCQERNYDYYDFAEETQKNYAITRLTTLSEKLQVVIPVSFYEKDENRTFNSIAVLDCGKLLGVYRKTHIPDDHYYQEKFYFAPGDSGFKVFETSVGKIGIGICWDQWFPETARCLTLNGAEILLYPTAIGSEPILNCDSSGHWQRVMQGHSASNVIPVVACNRIGVEKVLPTNANGNQNSSLEFYGSSFMTDETGAIIVQASTNAEQIIYGEYNLKEISKARLNWGLFRDRRPETYGDICKK